MHDSKPPVKEPQAEASKAQNDVTTETAPEGNGEADKAAKLKKLRRATYLEALLCAVGVILVVTTLTLIFGEACPSKLLFDFPCPFCGMTRAHLAALRLDFVSAFRYHPLFPFAIPFIVSLFFDDNRLFPRLKTPRKIFIIVMSVLLILIYLLRIFRFSIDFLYPV